MRAVAVVPAHPGGVMNRPARTGRLGPPAPHRDVTRLRQGGEEKQMSVGPVQLIVLGFNHPDFHGEVISALEDLRKTDTVRVIDALAVYKDADGELEAEHLSNLTEAEAIEIGSTIGALIGLGFEGEEGAKAGAAAGAQEAAAEGINIFGGTEEWDVLEDIPNDSAAALILLEHHW